MPKEVRKHYARYKIAISLKTTSSKQAATASKSITAKLEDYWLKLRLLDMEVPAAHILVESTENPAHTHPTISEALELYLRLKGTDKGKIFYQTAERNIKYIIKCLGNRSVDMYSSVKLHLKLTQQC